MIKITTKSKTLFAVLLGLYVTAVVSLIVVILWVATHFIVKYW